MANDAIVLAAREALWVTFQIGAPILGIILVVGVVISLIQALTQVNESTVAFLPKLLVTGGALLLLGPFMVGVLSAYTHEIFDRMVAVGGLP